MPCIANNGLVDRVFGAAALACVVLAGCTGSSTPTSMPTANSISATPASRAPQQSAEQPAVVDVNPAAAEALPASEEIAAASGDAQPKVRAAAKPVVEDYAGDVPQVLLSDGHRKLCKVLVGDVLPTIELPQLGGGEANLESLCGSKATVVLFWTSDAWMSETALRDLQRDVAGQFPAQEVAVVGIAVNVPADEAQKTLAAADAKFAQLLDDEQTAFATVGESALPRVYVLDGQRRIAWFDIEYAETTRRELQQTLAALAAAAR